VLTITTDEARQRSMIDAARRTAPPGTPGASLFLFAGRAQIVRAGPLADIWNDGAGRPVAIA
jgi:hypothetical protein